MEFSELTVRGVSRYLQATHLDEKSLRLHISRIEEPGKSSHPPHRHGGFEAFYIFEGEGTLAVGDTQTRLAAGESIVFDPQEMHGLTNTGSGPLRYMVIRAAQEDDPLA